MSEPVERAATAHPAPAAAPRAAPPTPERPPSEGLLQGASDPGATGGMPTGPNDAGPRLIAGRYLLEERIASGGMASVWRAHDELLARTVAVKLLHDHLAADDAFRERFRREAVAAARLAHPNVVALYDTGSDEGRTYLVMEYVEGATLKDVITDLGVLEPGQAASIGEKVGRALDAAHERGLVHRDIKPANILIGDDGAVKVADFGIAKAEDERADLTSTGMVLGTAAYVAPEQILGQPVDGRADQYALGCVLYEALTGTRPFKADSAVATAALRLDNDPLPLRSLRATVPKALDAVVRRALARRPDDRYPSAGAFADALVPFADATTAQTAALAGQAAVADDGDYTGGARSSFLRTEGRWLAPVLALLVLASVLVGVGLATGVLAPEDLPQLHAIDDPEPTAAQSSAATATATAAVARPVDLVDVTSFDPQGDDHQENDDHLDALVDDDPSTAWRTDRYNTAAFGNLKDGVGFVLDLGRPVDVAAVRLRTTTPGVRYDIRVAQTPAAELDGWQRIGEVTEANAAGDEVVPGSAVRGRYVLVWVTGALQQDGNRYVAGFSDVAVDGVAT